MYRKSDEGIEIQAYMHTEGGEGDQTVVLHHPNQSLIQLLVLGKDGVILAKNRNKLQCI